MLNVGKRKKIAIRFKKGRQLYETKYMGKRQRKKDRKDRRKEKQKIIEEDIYKIKITKEEETVEWKDRC
jgi:hypothetical protein